MSGLKLFAEPLARTSYCSFRVTLRGDPSRRQASPRQQSSLPCAYRCFISKGVGEESEKRTDSEWGLSTALVINATRTSATNGLVCIPMHAAIGSVRLKSKTHWSICPWTEANRISSGAVRSVGRRVTAVLSETDGGIEIEMTTTRCETRIKFKI
ncbi:hypothetical protein EVAR_90658_1 [Eumeta japonica]|uniref:Uncharacterized protein n=1 Tax=Eumeta variegata TaxID=151549 RepID=A0A4C1ZFP0_EUMVA|nr:hypothetical protein EVAR_90658_1 [Eumeta japonica]